MYNDDGIMCCDECGVTELEDDVAYEEFCDKHVCNDCKHEEERKWEEHQEFENWLKNQNNKQIFRNSW